MKMRRAHAGDARNGYAGVNNYGGGSQILEEENSNREEELSDKVNQLKHLTIDIGNEVREQNKYLNEMDDDFDNTGGFLGKTMKRVQLMARAGHNRYIFYLIAFCFFVFFLIWMIVRWR